MRQGAETFPSQQGSVCRAVLENFQEVAFMTVEQLARRAEVSPATVMRTIGRLGYSSFTHFLNDLQKTLISTSSPLWWQLEDSWGEKAADGILRSVSQDNIGNIHASMTEHLSHSFERARDLLLGAESIHVLGLRSTKGLAVYFHSMLHQFLGHVHLIGPCGSDEMFAELFNMSKHDVLFAISLGGPHFAIRTVQAVQFAKEQGIPVILLTSSLTNPGIPAATELLHVPVHSTHYSLIPAVNVIEALIVEIGRHFQDQATDRLRRLGKVLVENKITY